MAYARMVRTAVAAAAIAMTLGGCGEQAGATAAERALPPGALAVDIAEIIDASGFEKPLVAARALVPSGWRTQGGVVWNMRPCAEATRFNWLAVAPDGLTAVELFPTEIWAASAMSGPGECMQGDHRTVRAYLESYVQRRFPGARPLDYRARPEFLDANRAYIENTIALINSAGLGMRASADAGELLFAFQHNGADMRGVVAASAMFYVSELQNPMGGPPLWHLTGATTGTFGAYAPNGQLDFRRAELIRKSIKPDSEWTRRMFEHSAKLGAIRTDGVKDRAAIIVAGGAALTESTIRANNAAVSRGYATLNAGDAARSGGAATDDRIQRERLEALRGIETYHDPVEGGQVELDATFDHAWRVNNKDAYILTDDPNFNPGLYDIDAQQLGVVQ